MEDAVIVTSKQQQIVQQLKTFILSKPTDSAQFNGWDFVKAQAKNVLSKEEGGIVDFKIFTTLLDTGKDVTEENWKQFVAPAIAFKFPKTTKKEKYEVIKTFDAEHGHDHESVVPAGFDEVEVSPPTDEEVFMLGDILTILKDSIK